MRIILSFLFMAAPFLAQAASPYSDYFPELKGWKKPSEVKVYDPQTLWNIIDGAADGYLSYDFQELYTGDYQGKKGAYLTLEIYRHSTPENAFGIFRTEKPSDGSLLPIGGEAYLGEDFLNFVSGNFYVKIRTHEISPSVRDAMTSLARAVVEKLGGDRALPVQLGWFPDEGKVTGSEMYINTNFLGFSFLNKAFTAEYEMAGKRFSLFLISLPDAAAASHMLQEYLRFVKSEEPPFEGRHILNDKYNGTVAISLKGSCLLGVYNTDDTEVLNAYLEKLEKKAVCRP